MTFDKVEGPWWSEKPVAIVGNGPSLIGFDYTRLRDVFHVLAVKGAMFNMPWADAGFGLDIPRYREWCGILGTVTYPVYWATPTFDNKVMGEEHAPNVRFLRRIDINDVSDDPSAICAGGTSGYGAVNLAWLKKSRRMLLLGFDYSATAPQRGPWADGRAYVGDRPADESRWLVWAKNFTMMKRRIDVLGGAKIINASPQSQITAFPRMEIDAALKEIV